MQNNEMEHPQIPATSEPLDFVSEYREGQDRRQQPTPFLSRYTFFGGRRRGGRRTGEKRDIFVDVFGEHLFLVALLIVALNMLDAFFTLLLLSHGGEEANPVALWLLNVGPWAFILAKTIGIGLCTMLLVMIKNFRGARVGLGIVLAVYLLLLGWHFYLCIRIGIYG
jgi:hypothetical protein